MNVTPWNKVYEDGRGWLDAGVEAFYDRWKRNNFDGFPTGLLPMSPIERWEVLPDKRFEAQEAVVFRASCVDEEECGWEYNVLFLEPDATATDVEIECEHCGDRCRIDEDSEEEVWRLVDTHYIHGGDPDPTDHSTSWEEPDLVYAEGVQGYCRYYFSDQEDAEDACRQLDHEHFEPHGFPWASGRTWSPEGWFSDDELQAAGFTVAHFIGGDGNWNQDPQWRLVGVDGSDWESAFIRLFKSIFVKQGFDHPRVPVRVTCEHEGDQTTYTEEWSLLIPQELNDAEIALLAADML